ncbi:MAG TPA: mycothiol system anti-sigma-R factor [Acidimicrobiia bacterium]|nr:mycothiol system anti-sigma-R factor [Acidimicrobiia bacterium]
MNCHEAHSQMYEFIDGETTAVRRVRIRWHLRRCPPCGEGFRFEEALKSRIRQCCREEMPPELAERLMTFIHEHDSDGSVG